eukprot:CAMPEP_0113252652 /NCGR_PEP_ID=MMETSP0008_2-20120614/12755_1 /TAXON_ID=97485 /ORGANISM="Prymnesium parvum" /LENGTH=141 /DNA_ID=CAMNT_0000100763 /DNA_START=68 /DNA_END=493 /DNA_ORIENTATION=+ /assembly_acc=CAM_ASM_000153
MEPFGRRFQAHFEWGELSSTDAERKKVSSHHDISLHEAASCATLRARVLCCSLVTSPIIACASRLISGCGFVCLSLAPFIDQGVVEVSIGTGEERLNYFNALLPRVILRVLKVPAAEASSLAAYLHRWNTVLLPPDVGIAK